MSNIDPGARHFWEDAFDTSILTVSIEDFCTSGEGKISYTRQGGHVTLTYDGQSLRPSQVLLGQLRPGVTVEVTDGDGYVIDTVTGLLLGTSSSGNGMFIIPSIPEGGQPIGPLVIESEGPGDQTFWTFESELPAPQSPAN